VLGRYAQARHAELATIAGLPLANPHVPFVAKALARHVPARTIKAVALGWCDQHAPEGDSGREPTADSPRLPIPIGGQLALAAMTH
jgi:hypothetical protein